MYVGVAVFTLCLVCWFVYENPDFLLDESLIYAFPSTLTIACVVSLILCEFAVQYLGATRRLLIPTVFFNTFLTAASFLIVANLPGREQFVSNFIRSQTPLYRNPPALLVGNVSSSVLSGIREKTPDFLHLYMVDGTNAQNDQYWVETLDTTDGENLYQVSVYDALVRIMSPGLSPDQMWDEVRKQEKLSSGVKYTRFYGLPTREDGNKYSESFSASRTVYFQTSTGVTYSARLTPKGYDLVMSIVKK